MAADQDRVESLRGRRTRRDSTIPRASTPPAGPAPARLGPAKIGGRPPPPPSLDIRTVYHYRAPDYVVRRTTPTEALGRRFGATQALSGLDLAVEPGTVLGLLGHNGAGKTTAVRILTTLLSPSAGRAFVAGRDVAAEPNAVREQIAVAGQQASLDERLTGRENLMLLGAPAADLEGATPRRARASCSSASGIAHAAERQVGTYSGGMRRRLDLAACPFVAPRPVVFLDEPTTGLDPASRQGHVGARSRGSWPTASRSCSPPSTSKRPTASPTRSSCWPRAARSRPVRRRS